MFKVADYQIERLRDFSDAKYEQELQDALKARAPALVSMSDEDTLSQFILHATNDAKDIGFVSTRAQRFYIDVALICGTNVRKDPQFAFLGLPDHIGFQPEITVADRSHTRLIRYMTTVLGADMGHLAQAIRSGLSFEETLPEISDPQALAAHIGAIWPARMAFIGEPLIYHAIDSDLQTSFDQNFSLVRRALLTSIFGTEWSENPLCEWLLTDVDEQTDRLLRYAASLDKGV